MVVRGVARHLHAAGVLPMGKLQQRPTRQQPARVTRHAPCVQEGLLPLERQLRKGALLPPQVAIQPVIGGDQDAFKRRNRLDNIFKRDRIVFAREGRFKIRPVPFDVLQTRAIAKSGGMAISTPA